MPSNEQRRLGARGWPKAPFASLSHGETVSPDLDDWDYNYKLEGGRLISSNLYSGHSNLVTPLLSTSPSSLGGQQRPPAAPQMSLQVQYSNPQSTPLAAVDPQDEVTKWHDPDPVFQVVDCKDDTEFLSSLHRVNPVVVPKVGRNASGTWSSHNDARLKSWRQEIFQTAPELTPTMPKVRRKKETRKLATIEQVLNEMIMYPCDNPGDGSSTATSIAAESEMKKEMAMDSCVNSDADGVKICSSDGGIVLEFPRQTLALGGYFVKLMNREGFDGEIVLEEPKSAVEMLGAWMSRDLDFEITIETYEIPRLEKDVIPHLYNLPLDPFDAYNYGKQYFILPLVHQHESYVLAHFGEYIDTHLRSLMDKTPDGATELVRRYVNGRTEPSPTNKFKEWLAAGPSAPPLSV